MRNNGAIRAAIFLSLSLSPLQAAEVKPHPCRVPGYDQDVLCATYPVW